MGRRESIRVFTLLQRAVACGHGGAVVVPAQRTGLGGGVSRFLSTLAARDSASASELLTTAELPFGLSVSALCEAWQLVPVDNRG